MIFEPFYLTTDDVGQALKKFAEDRKLAPNSIDFELLSTQIQLRFSPDNEFADYDFEEARQAMTPQALLDPAFEIKQMHEIKIFMAERSKTWRVTAQVAADRALSKVRLVVKKESVLPAGIPLKEILIAECQKRKARLGLLVGVWDEMMFWGIDALVARWTKNPVLTQEEEIVLSQGIEPTKTRNDALRLVYKEKQEEYLASQGQKDRGFAYSVTEGETIIEYVKPLKGEAGRNCKGEYIPAYEPVVTYKPTFKIDPTIAIEETPDTTIFKAAVPGYVAYSSDKLTITDTMAVDELSFKKTGSVALRLESDVKLDINQGDITHDSIGEGVLVEVTDLKVSGSVGPDATIRAKNVEIGGQTHQRCKVFCETATIMSHRGYLDCDQATLKRVEGGIVKASRLVDVEDMVGGEITAHTITIQTLNSNAKLTAYAGIEVKNFVGQNNRFVIRPDGGDNKEIMALNTQREGLLELIKKKTKDLQRLQTLFAPYKQRYLELKATIDKKQGQVPPATLIEFKSLRSRINEMKTLKEDIDNEHLKLGRLDEMIEGFSDMIESAKVRVKTVWKGYNEVIFELSMPPVTLTYIPKDGERTHSIGVKKNHDGNYEIETNG